MQLQPISLRGPRVAEGRRVEAGGMAIRLTSDVTTNSGDVSERAAKCKGRSQVRTENQPLWAVGTRGFPGGVGGGGSMVGSSHSPGFPFSCTYSPPHEEGKLLTPCASVALCQHH